MKVMLPITDKEIGKETVARGFHNARYVCIYDSKSEVFEWMPAKAVSPNPGDFTKELQRMGIDLIISAYMPPVALRIFARNGLEVYKSRGINVIENIEFLKRNQLETFTPESVRQIWGCESGCGSCNSKSCA
jgi:predicted Fe-Mo cluster-binding NifX family protein